MPNNDDLRNGINIDISDPASVAAAANRKAISNINNKYIPSEHKKDTINRVNIGETGNTRRSVSIDEIAAPEPEDPNIKESLTKEILEGPDSLLEKYINNMQDEAAERLAEEDEKRAEEYENQMDNIEDNDDEENESILDNILSDDSDKTNETSNEEDIELADNDPLSSAINYVSEEETSNKSVEEIINEDEDFEPETTSIDNDNIITNSDNDEDDDDNEESLKKLQKLATEKLKPVSNRLNISSFSVLQKPTHNTELFNVSKVKATKWVLPVQESIVLMKEFSGTELEELRQYTMNAQNSITDLTKRFKIIYEHIVSPKPNTFNNWLKSTPATDTDHYFFAIYMACFQGANYIPKDCTNNQCKETYLTDDIPMMNMVKFENDEAKNKFNHIYKSEEKVYNPKGLYCTEIVPITDKIAIQFKDASLYNLIEISSLDQTFTDRYESTITYLPYIDNIYYIDQANQSLIPIAYKKYTNNASKTCKSKVRKYHDIFNTMSIDEFGIIKSYVSAIADRNAMISYVDPATTCPKCGTESPETPASAEEMVFIRYQLGALVNTSLK